MFVWTDCDLMCVLLSGLCFVLLPWSCCLCVLRLLYLDVFVCGMCCVMLYGLFMCVRVCVRRSWCLCVVSVDYGLVLPGVLLLCVFFRVCVCMSLCACFVNCYVVLSGCFCVLCLVVCVPCLFGKWCVVCDWLCDIVRFVLLWLCCVLRVFIVFVWFA